jgi:N6-adenosine-specific RNA methylase IME4
MTVLVADPPWLFGDKLPGPKRGAESHYKCMDLDALRAFPVPDADVLCLWRVGSMQLEALCVVKDWGFEMPTSEIVWVKTTLDGQRIRMGMGRTVRNAHEVCLVCRKGKPKRSSAAVLSVIEAPEPEPIYAPRTEHSAKPDAFYAAVEKLYPGPYIELFARRQREGWECHGDEL